MSGIDWLAVLFRWVHILSAVAAVGGALFMRVVLMPAARELPEAEHAALRERVRRRWALVLHTSIALLLVSGLVNYLAYKLPEHRGEGQAAYHAIFGVKFLAALVVFFLAIALAGQAKAFEGLRRDAPRWLAINVALAILVILLSGVLRYYPRGG